MRNKINEMLNDRNWTLYKLSKESKVSASTLYDFLIAGKIKYLGIENLMKVANAFGIPVEYFINDETLETLKEEHYNFIPDENIRMIARAGEHMTKEQNEELRNLAERLYGEAFETFRRKI